MMGFFARLRCVDCGFWLGLYRCERCRARLCGVCSDFPGPRLYSPGKGLCEACREQGSQEIVKHFPLRSAVRSLPPQSITSDVPVALKSGYTALEWINATRAIHGYEALPDEPPPDAHVVIHQIGTPEPIGWFDSKGNWYEAPAHADHTEMQYAPADWRRA